MGWGVRLGVMAAATVAALSAFAKTSPREPDPIAEARAIGIGRTQPFAVVAVGESLARKTTTLAFYVIPPSAGRPGGMPIYAARLVERQLVTYDIGSPNERNGMKVLEPRFANSRTCPALAASISQMANLTPPRIQPPILKAPTPSKYDTIIIRADGTGATLWTNAVSADGQPAPYADIRLSDWGDSRVLRWARGVIKVLAPCWTDKPPPG
jgi:hypothetical protein